MVDPPPTLALSTKRLRLRPFRLDDASTVARLANDPHILDVLLELPRPYGEANALRWIASHEQARQHDREFVFALCAEESDSAVGAATLHCATTARGVLGYWMGGEHRGQGLMSEAVRALVEFGFGELGLDRIEARHLARNPASGRVLANAGLAREVLLPAYLRDPHTGVLEDMVQWAVLADRATRIGIEWDTSKPETRLSMEPTGPTESTESITSPGGPRLATITLLVPDYDLALDWYVSRLGFTLVNDDVLGSPNKDGSAKRWLRVMPSGGGTHLLLARASNREEQAAVGRQGGGRVWLFLETDDFARDRARFESAGVEFVEDTRYEPYGTVAVFRDLVGNHWDLIEPAE